MSNAWMAFLWSVIGIVTGFPAGTAYERYRLGKKVQTAARQGQQENGGDPKEPVEVGVMVQGTEVDRVLVKPSPIRTKVIAGVLVFLGLATFLTTYITTSRQDDLRNEEIVRNCKGQAENRLLILRIARGDQELGNSLSRLLNAKNRAASIQIITELKNDLLSRAKEGKAKIPPLTADIIEDCKDGNLDGDPTPP